MLSPQSILQQYWNYSTFRPQQSEIINAVLDGNDTVALLPTGGGKSICYQVPALMKDGLCLVISPLVALMKDQVSNLHKKDIPALALHSGQTFFEVKNSLMEAINSNIKFLYVSPERLQSSLFKEFLPSLNINLIAVDEAHCVSQWGYDFRPPYIKIADIRDVVNAPMLAVTASATPIVLDDIQSKLQLKKPTVFKQSFKRANLSYSVFKVDSKINKTIEVLQNVNGSGIVYCKSRKLTKQIASLLNMQNLNAGFYHAGLNYDERNKKQEAWINNETRIMVCTNAFGMGIDKTDVRAVVHYDVPDCIENYYQEAGRAGRDLKKSYAVLLYNEQDKNELQNLPQLRFPPVTEIKNIYQALADYLQIPVGIGEGNYYDFNLIEFIKNFKLDIFTVINTLKILEQQGYVSFNESVFISSKICFAALKETLFEFEKSHPDLEPIIKTLLRTYEGIFDNRVSINERLISKLIKKPIEEIKQQLQQLNSFGVIEYEQQKETPQIFFITNRAPAQHLNIDIKKYTERKKEFVQRVESILNYMQSNICRSKMIGNYFGDTEINDCGVCDNCLKRKQPALTTEEFTLIKNQILNILIDENAVIQNVLSSFKNIRKEKVWTVLNHLQDEKIISIKTDMGIINLLKQLK